MKNKSMEFKSTIADHTLFKLVCNMQCANAVYILYIYVNIFLKLGNNYLIHEGYWELQWTIILNNSLFRSKYSCIEDKFEGDLFFVGELCEKLIN